MNYNAPGNTENLSGQLKDKWNSTIQRVYDEQSPYHSRFFQIDGDQISNPIIVHPSWLGSPAEPAFCRNENIARNLSDWGVRGRHEFHNEYCEYSVVKRLAPDGTMKSKRITVTTELRKYWVLVAMNDPNLLRSMANGILGYTPSWTELYGHEDPFSLTEREREMYFLRQVAGDGSTVEPVGSINTENALFMTHPINGLDDLIYILLFGAHPYAQQTANGRMPATKEQIFSAKVFGQKHAPIHLACRHADPAAATAAHQQAYFGKQISFANPLGIYINNFTSSVFSYKGQPLPKHWIRISRGQQRLVFGPDDSDAAFLEDIFVTEGADTSSVKGGYDVVKRIEVGPTLLIGKPTQVEDQEFVDLTESTNPIECSEATVCETVRRAEQEYNNSPQLVRNSPREMHIDRG